MQAMKEANVVFTFNRREFPDSRIIVEDYCDAEEMLEAIRKSPADIYILSAIGDERKNHLKLASEIKSRYTNRSILFVSNSFNDVKDIINASIAPAYIFSQEVTEQEYEKFISGQINKTPKGSLLSFTINNRKQLVHVQAILSAQANNKKLDLRFFDRTFRTSLTVAELEKTLPANFVRIDKGTIINSDHIVAHDNEKDTITLTNGQVFPVSRRGQKRLFEAIAIN